MASPRARAAATSPPSASPRPVPSRALETFTGRDAASPTRERRDDGRRRKTMEDGRRKRCGTRARARFGTRVGERQRARRGVAREFASMGKTHQSGGYILLQTRPIRSTLHCHHTYIKARVYNHTPSVRDATTRDDDTRRRDATTRADDVRADDENSPLHVRPNPRPSRARETRVRVDDDDDDEKGNERNDDSSRAR